MEMTAMLLAASLLGGWEPVAEDGEIHEKEGTRGDWHLFAVADPFGDPEGWFAATPTVDGKGEVRFGCMAEGADQSLLVPGVPRLRVFAGGLGREIPPVFYDWESMLVQLRVDGGETVEYLGTRPNEIARMERKPTRFDHDPLHDNDVVEMLQAGRKAVIRFEDTDTGIARTVSGEISLRRRTGLKYVFAASLDGFREASEWVIGRCGWKP